MLAIKFIPTGLYKLIGGEWQCQHIVQTNTAFDDVDEYREAITGEAQPIVTTYAMVCDHCGEVIENE